MRPATPALILSARQRRRQRSKKPLPQNGRVRDCIAEAARCWSSPFASLQRCGIKEKDAKAAKEGREKSDDTGGTPLRRKPVKGL